MLAEIGDGFITVYDKSQFSVRDIVESGQLFRYSYEGQDCKIVTKNQICILKEQKDCVTILTDNVDYFWSYFDLSTDYRKIKEALAPYDMQKALTYGSGIRMLKQDAVETIFSFIVSQNNNIPRIKGILSALSSKLGERLDGDYAFPTVEALASRDADFYRGLGLGYRSEYMADTAKRIRDGFVLRLDDMTTDEARAHLMTLKGVGPKVADCILLFGYQRQDVFPVDTWVKKIYQDYIGDGEANPVKMAATLRQKFQRLSGYAQQYLFYYYRNNYGKMED